MAEHPAESQCYPVIGKVIGRNPKTWEVDVELFHQRAGCQIPRVKINGTYLPEIHTDTRQSKVVLEWLDGYQFAPTAFPIHNDMIPDADKPNYVFWSEHAAPQPDGSRKGFRTTINVNGDYEVRSLTTPLRQVRILEQDGIVRLDTPSVSAVLKEADQSITVNCKDAVVNASGDVGVTAAGDVSITGAHIKLNG